MTRRWSAIVAAFGMACSGGATAQAPGAPAPVDANTTPAVVASTTPAADDAAAATPTGDHAPTADPATPATTDAGPTSTGGAASPPIAAAVPPHGGASSAVPAAPPAPTNPTAAAPPASTSATPASTTSTPATAVSPTAPPPATVDHPAIAYTLDPQASWLYVIVHYDRSSTITGHDHAVRATTFTGSVKWDVDDVSTCAVHIEFPASALHVDTPGLRARAGLDGESDPKDHPKIEDNFLGKSQLDASHFPTLHFTSTKCEATADGAKVTGLLGMHGVEKPVTMSMTVDASATSFHARGSLKFKHETFGFSPFSAALGLLKNDDTLELHVDVKGTTSE